MGTAALTRGHEGENSGTACRTLSHLYDVKPEKAGELWLGPVLNVILGGDALQMLKVGHARDMRRNEDGEKKEYGTWSLAPTTKAKALLRPRART